MLRRRGCASGRKRDNSVEPCGCRDVCACCVRHTTACIPDPHRRVVSAGQKPVRAARCLVKTKDTTADHVQVRLWHKRAGLHGFYVPVELVQATSRAGVPDLVSDPKGIVGSQKVMPREDISIRAKGTYRCMAATARKPIT